MIRKRRETSQTDLFSSISVLEKESIFTPPLEGSGDAVEETPEMFVKSFDNPILMSREQSLLNEAAAEDAKAQDIPPDDVPLPIDVPDEPPQPDTNELLTKDPERLIINRDFADGFYLSEESRTKHRQEDPETLAQRQVIRRRRFKIASVVILSLLALVLFNWQEWVVNSPLFTVQHVYVRDHFILTKDEVLRLANIEQGIRLSEVDLERTADRIRTNPLVRNVAVSRSYPSSIVITVYEREPFVFVSGDEVHAVDRTGFVLPRLRSNIVYNLPVITGLIVLPQVGRQLESPKLKTILTFLDRVRRVQEPLFYEISEIHVQKDDFIVYLNNLRTAFRIDGENMIRTAMYMNAAASYFRQNPDVRHVREIDLRYDGQVVVRRNPR